MWMQLLLLASLSCFVTSLDKPLEECKPGYYGSSRTAAIGLCQECGKCRGGAPCHSRTGYCRGNECADGFRGRRCRHTCSRGFYGRQCRERCSVNCRRRCLPTTGACIGGCRDGFIGDKCDTVLRKPTPVVPRRYDKDVFHDKDLEGLVMMVVDEQRRQLLAGGRDALYRLQLSDLKLLQRVEWPVDSPAQIHNCGVFSRGEKGKCHNFIRVLQIIRAGAVSRTRRDTLTSNTTQNTFDADLAGENDSSNVLKRDWTTGEASGWKRGSMVFICGTNAWAPRCQIRDASDLSSIRKTLKEPVGICPLDPANNATAVITSEGDVYSATNVRKDGSDATILRIPTNPYEKSRVLRGKYRENKWLDQPTFVSSYDIGNHVYFFFRENALEHINCGKKVFSRVARVCKSDAQSRHRPDVPQIWTTFHKARLNCSLPGEYPFYFDELQSTFFDTTAQLMYGVFTTPANSMPGSAVCVYEMKGIEKPFKGRFKKQKDPDSQWLPNYEGPVSQIEECSAETKKKENGGSYSQAASHYLHLMDKAALSRNPRNGPLFMREGERWTHIVIDRAETFLGSWKVIFVATSKSKVLKIVELHSDQACLIEEIDIFGGNKSKPINNMVVSGQQKALFITTDGDIRKIPVERCHRFTERKKCIDAKDPYCGWDRRTNKCTYSLDKTKGQGFMQKIDGCPKLGNSGIGKRAETTDDASSTPVNGAWSAWSEWSPCDYVSGVNDVTKVKVEVGAKVTCQCRMRACDSPAPLNNGAPCDGGSMEVAQCPAPVQE